MFVRGAAESVTLHATLSLSPVLCTWVVGFLGDGPFPGPSTSQEQFGAHFSLGPAVAGRKPIERPAFGDVACGGRRQRQYSCSTEQREFMGRYVLIVRCAPSVLLCRTGDSAVEQISR
jgi:hypothetical protein